MTHDDDQSRVADEGVCPRCRTAGAEWGGSTPPERKRCPVCGRLVARSGNRDAFNPHKHPNGGWCAGKARTFSGADSRPTAGAERGSQHTPGPWTTGKNGDDCAPGHAICHGPYVIAKVYERGYPIASGGTGWAPESQADATLIAAAPELLAALKGLVAHVEKWQFGETDAKNIARSRAAIAKAEGEP